MQSGWQLGEFSRDYCHTLMCVCSLFFLLFPALGVHMCV
jgi:hypothetical protein